MCYGLALVLLIPALSGQPTGTATAPAENASDKEVRCCGIDLRTIVGFEQTGAANAKSSQSYFF